MSCVEEPAGESVLRKDLKSERRDISEGCWKGYRYPPMKLVPERQTR